METNLSFGDLLEAVDQLSSEDQEALMTIVKQRAIERARKRIAAEAQEAQREFSERRCQSTSASDLMDEILS